MAIQANLRVIGKADSPNEVTSVLFGHSLPNLKQQLIFEINGAKFITNSECGNIPNIKTMGLSIEGSEYLEKFPTLAAMPMPTDLRFSKTYWSECDLAKIAENAIVQKLRKLDVSRSSGITGNLSLLLRQSFPSLNSLILSNCGLNSQDLCSMAQASVEGRLPSLNSLILSDCGLNSQDLRSLAQASVEGRLPSLNSLILSDCGLNSQDLRSLAQASVEGRFPSLNSLVLSDCGLNSQDLCSMAQASVEGRLPELKYLDISENIKLPDQLEYLFGNAYTWQTLFSFNFAQVNQTS